jgi:hypothetical protein
MRFLTSGFLYIKYPPCVPVSRPKVFMHMASNLKKYSNLNLTQRCQ